MLTEHLLNSFAYAFLETEKSTNVETAKPAYYALWKCSVDATTFFTTQKKLIRILLNIDRQFQTILPRNTYTSPSMCLHFGSM